MVVFVLQPHRIHAIGPLRAFIDPSRQGGDLSSGEALALWRHHLVHIAGRDEMQQGAFLRLARDDVRPRVVAPLQRRLFHVESQPGLLFLLSVAVCAVRCKDRLHVAHEVYRRGGGIRA